MAANLKEVRERIKSVVSTQQITKAMKMVSAAKLRKAQDAIIQMRPYANKLNEMMQNILSNLDGDGASAYGKQREVKNVAIIVITSNRGLCGAFNTNIAKAAAQSIEEKYADVRKNGKLVIAFIGKKGYDYFKRRYADCELVTNYIDFANDMDFDSVSDVTDIIMKRFLEERFDVIEVAYGRFKNAGVQFPEAEVFLPVPKIEAEDSGMRADYIFEPNQEELLEHLIPSILRTQFFKYLLDTGASEHGARMTAMDKATENAEELLKELKINYNKARQEAITNELSEIVGGAAALGG